MMDKRFSAKRRMLTLKELERGQWDLLVIGGGITGAGIALDAAARGMKTALIEMQDFSSGTSSRSTKLVHGGLRYLKQFEIRMVAEVGKERAVVYENGPHVTTPEPMLLPFYENGTFGKWSASLGLRLYDFLAGVKRGERRRMLSKEETQAQEPILKRDGLKGGGIYVEYRTDDSRLCIEVIKKAVQLGAKASNYVKAGELLYEEGRLTGVMAIDLAGNREFAIKARKIVNAAGPWVDDIRGMDGSKTGKSLRLTKGVHLVFDNKRFPLGQAVYFDTPDGRMMFAIPRDGKSYIGTTDTDYAGDPANPGITAEDADYILSAANGMFPGLDLSAEDVESGWAGLRPLIYEEGKSPSEISRRDEIFHSPSGLLTIAGGKLTGYRKMAETVTDLVARDLAREYSALFAPCATHGIPISGGEVGGSKGYPAYQEKAAKAGMEHGLSRVAALELAKRYGSNTEQVLALLPEEIDHDELEGVTLHSRKALPRDMHASLLYAIRHESALKPTDFLIRRTGALLFDQESARFWAEGVVAVMAGELEYTPRQLEEYRAELEYEFSIIESIGLRK